MYNWTLTTYISEIHLQNAVEKYTEIHSQRNQSFIPHKIQLRNTVLKYIYKIQLKKYWQLTKIAHCPGLNWNSECLLRFSHTRFGIFDCLKEISNCHFILASRWSFGTYCMHYMEHCTKDESFVINYLSLSFIIYVSSVNYWVIQPVGGFVYIVGQER